MGNQEKLEENDTSEIQLLILPKDACSRAKNQIFCEYPRKVFFELVRQFYGEKEDRESIGKSTFLSKKVKVGENTISGSNCTIDGEIVIGSNCHIGHNVTIIGRVVIGGSCY